MCMPTNPLQLPFVGPALKSHGQRHSPDACPVSTPGQYVRTRMAVMLQVEAK